ncbi:MAG: HAMP domain-containing protein, partial [Acidimicrobiia bacterium]
MPQVPHVPDRPLDAVTSIKVKLATLIVGAVGITVFVFWFCIRIVHVWPSAAGVIAGAVALILVSRLARGMTSPLREMATATQAMAKGDYSQTITATS